jgi:hypothetical protein
LKYNFDVKTILYLLWEKTNKNNNAGINCDRQVQVIPEKESFIYLFIYSLNDKHQDYRSNVNNSSVNEISTYEKTATCTFIERYLRMISIDFVSQTIVFSFDL